MRKSYSLLDMQRLAKSYGGECLSSEFINTQHKLQWRCASGHVWNTKPAHVLSGHWCRYCGAKKGASLRKGNIIAMHRLAKKRHGKCLSSIYVNNSTKLEWECVKGHRWFAQPSNIQQGKWCPICLGRNKSINDMQKYAASFGGKCLSSEYVNTKTKLKWQCKEGHIWEATFKGKQNAWCPICSQGLNESISRTVLENAFRVKFPKSFPDWLINSRDQKMELDGYNKKLGLAFEYNGQQHYEFIDFYHGDKTGFQRRIDDDKLKSKLCLQNGVNLIVIPYTIQTEKIADFIFQKCSEYGYKIKKEKFKWKPEEVYHSREGLIKFYRDIVTNNFGVLLSKKYLNNSEKLTIQCSRGHIFNVAPYHLKDGAWCPICLGRYKTIDEVTKFANSKGGKCLTKSFRNSSEKIKWECEKGHQWEAPIKYVLGKGTWCPYCIGRHRTIEEMNEIAKLHGGTCLSKAYKGAEEKLKWQCKEGHIWEALSTSIRRGQWCPICANGIRGKKLSYTIEDMHNLASNKEGLCLSAEYKGKDVPLQWECKEGHRWMAAPNSVRQGSWCRTCSIEKRKNIKTTSDK